MKVVKSLLNFSAKNPLIWLGIIFLFAIVSRLFLFSNFDYYSDSHYFLLTAKFVKEHFTIDGFLGAGGEYFQPLFYKLGYSLFIAFADLFVNNLSFSAHLVSFLFGAGSILLFWYFVKDYSTKIKVFSTILFAFSFSTMVLPGFILSEATGLFFLLLALVLLQAGSPLASILSHEGRGSTSFALDGKGQLVALDRKEHPPLTPSLGGRRHSPLSLSFDRRRYFSLYLYLGQRKRPLLSLPLDWKRLPLSLSLDWKCLPLSLSLDGRGQGEGESPPTKGERSMRNSPFGRGNILNVCLAGIVFGIAILTRIEFIFLLIPFAFWKIRDRQIRSFLIFTAVSLTIWLGILSVFVFRLQLFSETLSFFKSVFINSFLDYAPYLLGGVLILISVILWGFRKKAWSLVLIIAGVVSAVVVLCLKPKIWFDVSGFWAFLQKEPMLIFGFAGLLYLFKNKGIFYSIVLILLAIYLPRGDYRFFIYLVPFLALGSALFFDKVFNKLFENENNVKIRQRYVLVSIGVVSVFAVAFASFSAFLPWHPEKNYEKIFAENVSRELSDLKVSKEIPILSYFPEPVYLETNNPCFKFSSKSKDWKNLKDDQEIVLILDEASYIDDPGLYQKVYIYLSDKQTAFFNISTILYINSVRYLPVHPAIIFRIKKQDLEKVVALPLSPVG